VALTHGQARVQTVDIACLLRHHSAQPSHLPLSDIDTTATAVAVYAHTHSDQAANRVFLYSVLCNRHLIDHAYVLLSVI
jgi:hypothetical protein